MTRSITEEMQWQVDEHCARLLKEKHERCAAVIVKWFESARKDEKKATPERMAAFVRDVNRMCEEMTLTVVDGEFKVTVRGQGESTYRSIKYGTDWFEPNDKVDTLILAGLDDRFGI